MWTIARRAAATGLAAAALTAALGTGVAHASPVTSACMFVKSATTTVTFQGKSTTRTLENANDCATQFEQPRVRDFTNHANLQDPTNPKQFIMSTPAIIVSNVQADGSFRADVQGQLRTGASTALNTSTVTKTLKAGFDVKPNGTYTIVQRTVDAAGHVADTTVTFKTLSQTIG
jgi:septal ring-binding cell division protein DamX